MRFFPLSLPGAWRIELEPHFDDRGSFSRLWCSEEFAQHGLPGAMVQASLSVNRSAGTLRGMHFAFAPAREGKLVRCIVGAAFDVLLDMRPASPAFLSHEVVQLDPHAMAAVYVPPGVAHGFQTLDDWTEILYIMTEAYRPTLQAGVRFDDPAFRILWPRPVTAIAEHDRTFPMFDAVAHRARGSAVNWEA